MNDGSLYKYCETCPDVFENAKDKALCSLHWRPKSGTKFGFPTEAGENCPRDFIGNTYLFYVVMGKKQKVPNNWLKRHAFPMNRTKGEYDGEQIQARAKNQKRW